MYLCTVMVATGTFYGVEQSTLSQDIFASFTISLVGTLPVLIIRKVFEKSKPQQVKSEKHNLDELQKRQDKEDVADEDDLLEEHNGDQEGEGGC